ncbi:superoxide dismutase [Cu-Zn] SodC [Atlantibacter sp.]|uniref:superoxide dismutase [Cu-Zn] SodC n=1 Tax=Atlantibacter sp. TaxID=1903473 RepID=UPI00289ACF22|nr:superoxide dismutase [Cu-Zn] SodC [Atlantibacter sp.]
MKKVSLAVLVLLSCGAAQAQAASEDVEMHLVTPQGIGQSIGEIEIEETDNGLKFTPDLKALPPGERGFHIHAKGSCEPAMKDGKPVAAGAASGHLDPHATGKHRGPEGAGHTGDLPVLVVDKDGKAKEAVIAPRLKSLDDIKGKALMIHAGGDNMSDKPEPLGGGGERFACGVIKS